MNANNQQSSFKTHWVNDETINDALWHLNQANDMINALRKDAEGNEALRKELNEAFHHSFEAILAMRAARFINVINNEEE